MGRLPPERSAKPLCVKSHPKRVPPDSLLQPAKRGRQEHASSSSSHNPAASSAREIDDDELEAMLREADASKPWVIPDAIPIPMGASEDAPSDGDDIPKNGSCMDMNLDNHIARAISGSSGSSGSRPRQAHQLDLNWIPEYIKFAGPEFRPRYLAACAQGVEFRLAPPAPWMVVTHAQTVIDSIRCGQFKWGVTRWPARRFLQYLGYRQNWRRMIVLYATANSSETHDMETALICRHHQEPCCWNSKLGIGKGTMLSDPPHFLYLVVD